MRLLLLLVVHGTMTSSRIDVILYQDSYNSENNHSSQITICFRASNKDTGKAVRWGWEEHLDCSYKTLLNKTVDTTQSRDWARDWGGEDDDVLFSKENNDCTHHGKDSDKDPSSCRSFDDAITFPRQEEEGKCKATQRTNESKTQSPKKEGQQTKEDGKCEWAHKEDCIPVCESLSRFRMDENNVTNRATNISTCNKQDL